MIRVALADDQALVRNGLKALLQTVGEVRVEVEAEDGEQLLQALRRVSVDVILSDIRMPRRSGIELVRLLRERGDHTPVLLLTTFDDPVAFQAALQAGAEGYMLKDAEPEALLDALQRLARGEKVHSPISLPSVISTEATVPQGAKLSRRELSVLKLVAGGYSNKEIGSALCISDGTVKNHLTDIMQKLDARDRTHAVLKAISARLM